MKQKMVVKVTMVKGDKSLTKAKIIAVGLSGVESASLKGDDKSQREVTGDGVDAAQLTILLRKSVGYAELVSVSAADGEKKDEKKEEPKPPPVSVLTPNYNQPYCVYCEVPSYGCAQHHEFSCSIM